MTFHCSYCGGCSCSSQCSVMVIKAQHSGLMTWWNLTHLQCPAVLQVYDKLGWSKLQHCHCTAACSRTHWFGSKLYNEDQMKHMATVTIIIQIIIELTTYKSKWFGAFSNFHTYSSNLTHLYQNLNANYKAATAGSTRVGQVEVVWILR